MLAFIFSNEDERVVSAMREKIILSILSEPCFINNEVSVSDRQYNQKTNDYYFVIWIGSERGPTNQAVAINSADIMLQEKTHDAYTELLYSAFGN